MDSRQRSLVKAAIWQGMGLVTMIAVGWAFTGSATLGGGIALTNMMIGFVAYLAYERVWAGIGWGRTGGGRGAA